MDFIKVETIDEGVEKIFIDKEKSLNALNSQVLKELKEALESESVKKARVLFLDSAGDKAFVAGADIAEMNDFTSVQAREFSKLGHQVFLQLESLKAVTISLVNGYALGGGFELALSTDIILATKNSQFGLPEVSLGLIPGFGGTQRLSRSLGTHFAKALTLTGEMVGAEELFSKGLVYKVFDNKDELISFSKKIADKILLKGPYAVYVAKQTIQKGRNMGVKEALELEQQEFSLLFGTKENQEGITAFLEKRKPNFTH
jgi:enoyl-CoA hydratase